MQEPINVEVDVIKQVFLWFLPYQPTDPEALNSNNEVGKLNANVRHSFDIVNVDNNQWIIYIDIEINIIPLAKIKVRTTFNVKCPEELLFEAEVIDTINKNALQTAEKGFFQECKARNIKTNFTKTVNEEEFVSFLRDNMVYQFNDRKKHNSIISLKNKGAYSLTKGNGMLLITQGTFIILDNVLHANKLFNLVHNQQVFHNAVPEPMYYTIKFICMDLIEKKIDLSLLHAALFQICLECAIQLLLDRHAQTLQPAIIEVGLTPDKQKLFIEYGSSTLLQFRNDYKASGSKIENFEARYDWNSLIE